MTQTNSPSSDQSQERLQMIDTLKAPIIQLGQSMGFEVNENYDLGAGPVHVAWTFKPGSESLPDIRLGFVCMTEYSETKLNEAIARSMTNLVDKLVIVVPSENITKQISDSIENMPNRSLLQLRKYVTVTTPSTLVPKTGVSGSRQKDNQQTGEII